MIVALVPLRGNSKSIPKKNIKMIAGKPLCAWVLEATAHSHHISTVYVSTDSEEIADIVSGLDLDIQIINRPAEYATDEASTESVMLHFADQVSFDYLVTVQATSPLLRSVDLDEALDLYHAEGLDSMLSAVRTKHFFWRDDNTPINYDPLHRPRRQDYSGILMENGAFYVTSREILQKNRCRLGGKIGIYEMAESTSFEIDEPVDWITVESLLKNHKSRK
jgi:CMP-N-acetylneuraminic acid synthetase